MGSILKGKGEKKYENYPLKVSNKSAAAYSKTDEQRIRRTMNNEYMPTSALGNKCIVNC